MVCHSGTSLATACPGVLAINEDDEDGLAVVTGF